MPRFRFPLLFLLTFLLTGVAVSAQPAPAIAAPVTLRALSGKPHRVWQRSEFVLSGIPAAANPYDPDVIAVDVIFTSRSGKTVTLPAFWYQDYSRVLKGDTEKLTVRGGGGWRVRYTPVEAGQQHWRVLVTLAGKPTVVGMGTLTVAARAAGAHGFVRVEPKDHRYFMLDDRTPLPLLGECACWHGKRGTYDYDDWFHGFAQTGMNYTRLWMWQNAFGVEIESRERLHYNQERAWQLDYVLDLAARKGIYVMLCLDYHGVFQDEKDMWGGNDLWPTHPYNISQGGPCRTQNDFFTNPQAKSLYRKRLRYLVARYSSQPSLMSWEFFNEIDNVYRKLKPADVVAWHAEMSQWMGAQDPYRHPVSTSFGSATEFPEMWQLPEIAFAQSHLYMNWPGPYVHPASAAAEVGTRFPHDYHKPAYIGEFGVSGEGWKPALDPHYRGLRQALWGSIFGGAAGTAMPWWWEAVHRENLYPLWGALHRFLDGTNVGAAGWRPCVVEAPGESPALGVALPKGAPFDVTIPLAGKWGEKPAGSVTLRRSGDAEYAPLPPYLHGSSKPELRVPFRITAWAGQHSRLVIHVNSVSNDAVLAVRANGREIFRRALPNKDGKFETNKEYDEDVTVPLPPGRQEIELFNPGGDWLFLDTVRLTGLLPTIPAAGAPVPLLAYGLSNGKTAVVWALDPRYNWPRARNAASETLAGARLTMRALPDGVYRVEWWDTHAGRPLKTVRATSAKGKMVLSLPPFSEDIAARVQRIGR